MAHNRIVYLLHLERSYRHARHYIGFTQNLEQRLAATALAAGARRRSLPRSPTGSSSGSPRSGRAIATTSGAFTARRTRGRGCARSASPATRPRRPPKRRLISSTNCCSACWAGLRSRRRSPRCRRNCAGVGSGSGACTAGSSCSRFADAWSRPGCPARSAGQPSSQRPTRRLSPRRGVERRRESGDGWAVRPLPRFAPWRVRGGRGTARHPGGPQPEKEKVR